MEAQPRTVAGGEGRVKAASPAFIFFFFVVLLCKRATVLTKFPAQNVIEHLEVTKKQSVELRLSARVCHHARSGATRRRAQQQPGGPRIALRCRCHHASVSGPAAAALLAATEQARKSLA